MNSQRSTTTACCIFLSALLMAACGEDSTPLSETTVTTAGGTATSSDGKLTLEIPPGALSADTKISIRKLEPSEVPAEFEGLDGSADVAYEFAPDGLVFSQPATMRFTLDADPQQVDGSVGANFVYPISNGEDKLFALDGLALEIDRATNTTVVTGAMSHFSVLKITDLDVTESTLHKGEVFSIYLKGVPLIVEELKGFTATLEATHEPIAEAMGRAWDCCEYTDVSVAPVGILSETTGDFEGSAVGERLAVTLDYTCTGIGDGKVVLDTEVDVNAILEREIAADFFLPDTATIRVTAGVECVGAGGGGGGDGFHETCSDAQVCTGGSDVNTPPAATDIKSVDVISAGGVIEATIVFNGDAQAHDAATTDKFPFSLQFNMTGDGPHPEAYFIEKAKMKMSNQGNIVSYIFFGDTLTIEIDGISLPDVEGIQAGTFHYLYSLEDGSTIECSQLCKSANY